MKKKTAILLVAAVLLIASIGLCADWSAYTRRTKSIPRAESGLILSITTFDGKTESQPFVPCLGHTWLALENRTGHAVSLNNYEIKNGECLTFSIWATSEHCGVFYNLEAEFIRQHQRYVGRQSLSVGIDESQLPAVEAYLRDNDDWTPGKNCSRWAAVLWNDIAGESCGLKSQTVLYTPKRLQRSFEEFDCVEQDKDFSGAHGVFFYQNGVRTECRLCS